MVTAERPDGAITTENQAIAYLDEKMRGWCETTCEGIPEPRHDQQFAIEWDGLGDVRESLGQRIRYTAYRLLSYLDATPTLDIFDSPGPWNIESLKHDADVRGKIACTERHIAKALELAEQGELIKAAEILRQHID